MSKKQKQMILLAVLVPIIPIVFYFKVFKKSEEELAYMERAKQAEQEREQQQDGASSGSSTPSAAAAPSAGANGSARPAPGAPALAEEITLGELQQLITEIQPVEFNYDEAYLESALTRRNPMSPLVSDTGAQIWQPGGEADYAEVEEAGEGQTPTQQTFDRMMQAQAMAISGIVWSSDNPAAVINDEIVNIGSQVSDDIYVEAIEEDRVLLRVGDQTVPLELKEP
jgi:hypothetical protein